ncbi:Aquaporin SIP1-1 [Glycine soja]
MVGAIKAAIGDAVLTFMWVFCSSVLGIASGYITNALNLQHITYNGFPYASFLVTTTLVFVLVFLFTIIGNVLGGASFNPTGTASFYAVGLGSDTLFSMALRFPAQAAGAAGGAMAIMEVIPAKYRHMIGGPSLKVDLHTGAVAEGVLTFVITFAVLLIFLRGPRSDLLKTWLLATATVVLVMVGSAYTGPAMNPANKACVEALALGYVE